MARLAIATRHSSEPHAWSVEVEAGAKSELKPAALGAGHPRRGARPVLRDAGAAEISQARPHRGRGRARGGAPACHEPAGCRLHARRRGARARDLCRGAARRHRPARPARRRARRRLPAPRRRDRWPNATASSGPRRHADAAALGGAQRRLVLDGLGHEPQLRAERRHLGARGALSG